MNEEKEIDRTLSAELAALRVALHDVRASADGEAALVAALRARHALADSAPAAHLEATAAAGSRQLRRARGRAWRAPAALAAAAALAAVTAILTLRVEPGAGPALPVASALDGARGSTATPPPARRANFAGAFQPLAYSSGLSPGKSYSVVRVRIPLTALAPGQPVPLDATIEADVLVGEDGLASGIRFNEADTLFVSTISKEMGERR